MGTWEGALLYEQQMGAYTVIMSSTMGGMFCVG
jgi:hypothetical protein